MAAGEDLSRRKFLNYLGAAPLTGYSVVVAADAFAAPCPAPPASLDTIREEMDRLSPGPSLDDRIAHEPNMRVVPMTCDFLVAGGGMAGVCAAIAAARNGVKVVLVQDRSRLGGNASSEIRMHIVGADHHGNRAGWREGGILEELRIENSVHNPHHAWELWDLLLYDKVVSEPNITLILDASVYAAAVEGNRITEVLARCDKTEHIYRIQAKQFADCTGDCRLGLEAGAAMRSGHESTSEFDEPLAPEDAGPGTLGSSILFTAKDYGKPIPFTPPQWARKVTEKHLYRRGTSSWEYGYWWIEWGGDRDAVHDNERIRFELLSIVLGVWDYIKNSGEHPDSANWGMDWIGMIPGKRSSRRMEGPHILTQQDAMSMTGKFPDAVAIGGWPFDNHPPGGFDATDQPPYHSLKIKDVYSIPLRCLYSRNIDNLFMAGRNISASHVAFSSTRVMATCSVCGQAAGTAAAYCADKGITPAQLSHDAAALDDYQQTLLRDDQTILHVKNNDPKDFARGATVEASHTVDGSAPENVLDGYVRDLPGDWKHRWGGELKDGEAWIKLSWPKLQRIGLVQLCFDSGFHRQLTLTEASNHRRNQHAGAQPETVRDYRIEAWDEAQQGWTVLTEETGNYLRLRRHGVGPVDTKALRLVATATNGNPEARLYEIRCYAECTKPA
jgi:hypothetical protein